MKRLIFPALAALMLVGCASARQSEFFDHSSVYTSWSHLKFSTLKYQNPDQDDFRLSSREQWWGMTVSPRPRPQVTVEE